MYILSTEKTKFSRCESLGMDPVEISKACLSMTNGRGIEYCQAQV